MKYSIIIITYNRDDILEETLSHLYKVIGENLDECEVVFVDNNADKIDRSGYLKAFPHAQYIPMDYNGGVTGGRNAGIKQSRGEYLIFIDDDAFLHSKKNPLDLIAEAFKEHPRVKILAHKSINYYTGKIDRNEFPHPDKSRDSDQTFRPIDI